MNEINTGYEYRPHFNKDTSDNIIELKKYFSDNVSMNSLSNVLVKIGATAVKRSIEAIENEIKTSLVKKLNISDNELTQLLK